MYYVADSGAYVVDDEGVCKGIGVTVVDKVTTIREIESISCKPGSATTLPAGAVPATLHEIVAKFNVSQSNPLADPTAGGDDDGGEPDPVQASAPAALSAEPVEPEEQEDSAEPVNPEDHTRDELVAMAEQAGVEVPSKATKAEIAELINQA